MHIEFFLEENIVRRAQKTARSMGKTLEGFLLDEVQKLADASPCEPAEEMFEERPGVGSAHIRRTVREEIYRLD